MEYEFLYDIKCRKCESVITMWAGSSPSMPINGFHNLMVEKSKIPTSGQCEDCLEHGHVTVCDYISWYKRPI
jgi:hypothetical protein